MPRIFDVLLGRTKPVQADLDALFGLVGAQFTLQAAESLIPTGQAGVCFKPVAGRSFADTANEASQLLGLEGGAPSTAVAPAGPAATAGSDGPAAPAGATAPTGPAAPAGPDAPTGPAGSGGPASPAAEIQPLRASVHQEDDKYGFHWVVQTVPDFQELVNQVHLVNSTLQDGGYGPQLLCSVFAFRPDPTAPAGSGAPQVLYLVYLYKRGAFYPFVPLPGEGERRDVEAELRLQTVLADDVKIESDKERWMPLWGLPVH